MTDTIKTFVKSLGTFESIPATQVARATYEDNGTQALNRLTVDFTQDITSGTYNPFYNREFKYDIDGTEIFGGRVEKPAGNDGTEPIYTAECWSYGGQFLTKLVNEIYENIDAGALVEDLINTYTDLTYTGSTSIGVTIERIVFRDKPLSECLQIMANLLGYYFTTDASKNCNFLQWGSTSSGFTFDLSSGDVLFKPKWEYNSEEVVTSVIVEGGLQQFNDTESFTASASQTEFTLAYQPVGSVKVEVNSVTQDPKVSEQKDGDYTVKIEDKKIVFEAGLTGGETVDITYSYNVKIKVQADAEVFDDDGNNIVKEGKVINKELKSTQEARDFASDYLTTFSQPAKSTVIPYKGFPTGAEAGQTCRVIDTEEGIDETFIIESIVYTYETGLSEITAGSVRQNLYSWQAQVNERLRQIGQTDTDEDKLQIIRSLNASVQIDATPGGEIFISSPTNSLIRNHITLGYRRTGFESEVDCSGNGNHGTWNGTGIDGAQYIAPFQNNYDFTSGWTALSATIDDADSFTTAGAGGIYTTSDLFTAGVEYTITVAVSTTASSYSVRLVDPGVSSTTIGTGDGTYTFTPTGSELKLYVRNTDAGTTDISDLRVDYNTTSGAPLQRLSCGVMNGTDNYIECPTSASLNADVIKAWAFFVEFDDVSTQQWLCGFNNQTNSGERFDVFLINTGKIRFSTYDGSTSLNRLDSDTTLTTGTKYFVVCQLEGTTKKIYINGVDESTTQTQSTTPESRTHCRIGARGDGADWFGNKLDEVMAFDDVLSTDDMQDIMDNKFYSNHSKFSNCKLWWSMDNPVRGNKRTNLVSQETF